MEYKYSSGSPVHLDLDEDGRTPGTPVKSSSCFHQYGSVVERTRVSWCLSLGTLEHTFLINTYIGRFFGRELRKPAFYLDKPFTLGYDR